MQYIHLVMAYNVIGLLSVLLTGTSFVAASIMCICRNHFQAGDVGDPYGLSIVSPAQDAPSCLSDSLIRPEI